MGSDRSLTRPGGFKGDSGLDPQKRENRGLSPYYCHTSPFLLKDSG